jgi:hypothetical protein
VRIGVYVFLIIVIVVVVVVVFIGVFPPYFRRKQNRVMKIFEKKNFFIK